MNLMILLFIVMFLSVSLIYKIAAFFGLHLKLQLLLLCALCASVISFITLTWVDYLTSGRCLLIFGLLLFAACLVNRYSEQLSRRIAVAADAGSSDAAIEPESLPASLTTDASQDDADEELPPDAVQAADIQEIVPEAIETADIPEILPDAVQTADIQEPMPDAVQTDDIQEILPEPVQAAVIEEILPEATVKDDPANTVKPSCLPVPLSLTIDELVRQHSETARRHRLKAKIAELLSLDALLDYAHEQKDLCHYGDALFAFKQALHKYKNDAYAPFIIIEMGNIYKDTGLYDEALSIYAKAFMLPPVAADTAAKENFQAMISYLRIVKGVLSKYKNPQMPFQQIPPLYRREIEASFANRHTKKHLS